MRHAWIYGYLLALGSCGLAALLEKPRELGWLWASSVLVIYFTLVIVIGKWWRIQRSAGIGSGPDPKPRT